MAWPGTKLSGRRPVADAVVPSPSLPLILFHGTVARRLCTAHFLASGTSTCPGNTLFEGLVQGIIGDWIKSFVTELMLYISTVFMSTKRARMQPC